MEGDFSKCQSPQWAVVPMEEEEEEGEEEEEVKIIHSFKRNVFISLFQNCVNI